MDMTTADLCDSHEALFESGSLRVLTPMFQQYGGAKRFCGPAVTVKVFEENGLIRDVLNTEGGRRVLVVDGGGSLRCALVGGNLGEIAVARGWAGVLVFGGVRDREEMSQCDVGIAAIGMNPRRCARGSGGQRDVTVALPGATVRPAEWIYADLDGVLVSGSELKWKG
ncbi:putative regulator of ribonuclease activity [Paraburkholderia piptadeniae]|uniref:4-hydroxy-4-methyl-2-oxoglutarate aldolase n=2 Tax=Paraburkholderia TaxID=1822464 RepID=A0A7X1TL29_9BURK|nr:MULTISPECIES: ribonuclease E activity regulator RraA [Paraburkholderia]MPW23068.1 ribonuclease E activity regulator RraA [Paraburkholderia franconis]SIT50984.1 putative regulator of ribonuclease activity [Paraburkholderia piptadeniae]